MTVKTPYDTWAAANPAYGPVAVVAFGTVVAGAAPVTMGALNLATTGSLFVVFYGRPGAGAQLCIERSTDSGVTWSAAYRPFVCATDALMLERGFVQSPIAPATATGSALYRLSCTGSAPGAIVDWATYQ